MGFLDDLKKQVDTMDPDVLRAEFEKAVQEEQKRKARSAEYNTRPEVQEKRKAYAAAYNANPEVQAKRKAYMQKPEVKARMKEHQKARRDYVKLLFAKAQELGIEIPKSAA